MQFHCSHFYFDDKKTTLILTNL